MQLFYREKGNADLPPLILLHGLWGASDNWLPVAARLSGQFHVILPDLRNHGGSPHLPEHDYEILSKDIADFIASLNLPVRPFIAGHSMGGKALMLLLLKQPEIAEKAAIIDICPKDYPATDSFHLSIMDFISKFPLHNFHQRHEIHQAIRLHFPDEQLCQLLFKNICKTDKGYSWKINVPVITKHLPQLLSWPLLPKQATYPFPILFIRGELSDYITPVDLPLIRSYFPAATLTTIPSASHRIHADNPILLSQAIADFFLSL